MGWSTGSLLMSEIIDGLKVTVPDEKVRAEIYQTLIPAFENYDCDNLNDCLEEDSAFDLAFKEASYFANDDEEDEYCEEEKHYEDE